MMGSNSGMRFASEGAWSLNSLEGWNIDALMSWQPDLELNLDSLENWRLELPMNTETKQEGSKEKSSRSRHCGGK